jgi:hypothetical protein
MQPPILRLHDHVRPTPNHAGAGALEWLVGQWQWPPAALFAAVFLLALVPLIAATAGEVLALVFLQLPVYMLHQGEEHLGDRFRLYANRVIGGGREALTPVATFWINCLGVWGVDLAALYLAWAGFTAAGLVAGYLALVNALLHIGPAVARREYNPGLITAVTLFPLAGGWCVAVVGAEVSLAGHLLALCAAIGVHGLIVIHVATRLARLRKAAP